MKKTRQGVRDPWLCLPVVVSMLLDAGVSLACQPSEYWDNPAAAYEGNPAWAPLLARGPGAFLAGFAVYCVAISGLLVWLTGTLQKLLGMFVLLAHSYGAASWCHVKLPDRAYWWGLMGLFLIEATTFAAYWHCTRVSRVGRSAPSLCLSDVCTACYTVLRPWHL